MSVPSGSDRMSVGETRAGFGFVQSPFAFFSRVINSTTRMPAAVVAATSMTKINCPVTSRGRTPAAVSVFGAVTAASSCRHGAGGSRRGRAIGGGAAACDRIGGLQGLPAAIVSTLTAAIDKAGVSPQFTAAMANIGLEPGYQPAAEFTKFWNEDARRAEDTIRQIGKVG